MHNFYNRLTNNVANNKGNNLNNNQSNEQNVQQGSQPNQQERVQHQAKDLVDIFTEHSDRKTHQENAIFDKETGKQIKWINLFKDTSGKLADAQAAKINLHRIIKECHGHLKHKMMGSGIDNSLLDQKFYRWDSFMKYVRPIKSVERENYGTTIGIQLGFVGAFDASVCGMFFAYFAQYFESTEGIAFERNNWSLQSIVRKDQEGNEILTQKQFFMRRVESISFFDFLKERIGRVDNPKDREIWVMDNLPSIESEEDEE